MIREETITIRTDKEFKAFLEGVAEAKGMTLSDYGNFVLHRGADAIYERNLALRQIGQQLCQKKP